MLKVYYAKISELSEEEMQNALRILPQERIEKIKRRKQKKSQLESIWAGLLLEYALQEHGLKGMELTFLKNIDGKPYIAEYPKLFYNLSHSKEYVAIVIDDYPVGVDVEETRIGYQSLVTRFFAQEEIIALQECWSDQVFTKLWTRKESYLKATGFGMRMPLDGFSTLQEQVRVNENMPKEMSEDVPYYLASTQLEDNYWLSVCRKAERVIEAGEVFSPIQVDLKRMLIKGIENYV